MMSKSARGPRRAIGRVSGKRAAQRWKRGLASRRSRQRTPARRKGRCASRLVVARQASMARPRGGVRRRGGTTFGQASASTRASTRSRNTSRPRHRRECLERSSTRASSRRYRAPHPEFSDRTRPAERRIAAVPACPVPGVGNRVAHVVGHLVGLADPLAEARATAPVRHRPATAPAPVAATNSAPVLAR